MCSITCMQTIVLLLLVFALAVTVIALATDYWCDVSTKGFVGITSHKENNYRFGLWRTCYDSIPDRFINDPDVDRSGSDCIWTFRDLIPDDFDSLSSDRKKVIHLTRSVIGLSITAAALHIAALITLICGSVPGDCNRIQRPALYTVTAFIVLFAAMAGIASGICFIAARDVEEESSLDYDYLWSFMLHWIGTGLAVFAGFITLCMLKNATDDINENMKYYYDM